MLLVIGLIYLHVGYWVGPNMDQHKGDLVIKILNDKSYDLINDKRTSPNRIQIVSLYWDYSQANLSIKPIGDQSYKRTAIWFDSRVGIRSAF